MRAMIIAVAVAMGGCSWRQQHLIPDYGASFDRARSVQAVGRSGPPAAAVGGLDSQEAAIISDTYRAGLAPKGAQVKEPPVLVVSPTREKNTKMPAPSVPKE